MQTRLAFVLALPRGPSSLALRSLQRGCGELSTVVSTAAQSLKQVTFQGRLLPTSKCQLDASLGPLSVVSLVQLT